MKPLLELDQISKHFLLRSSLLGRLLAGQPNRVVHAVNGVSMEVYEGETLGLVGESGSGKSTLGRVAIRLQEPTSGTVRFRGQDLGRLSAAQMRQLRREMQIIFQNPYSSLNPRKSVRDIIGSALMARGIRSFHEREREIRYLLQRAGLPERFIEMYPHQLSGGQRQRISILRALAVRPRLVVADEPVSALDVSVQAQILQFLEELKREFGLTYLFISHDLRVVYHISDRVAVMYLGKLVEVGRCEDIYHNPQHPYTKALLASIPRLENRTLTGGRPVLEGSPPSPLNPPKGCPFHTRCPVKLGRVCEEEPPPWVSIRPGHQAACHLLSQP
jgi:oligopeptide/dipeptide ABC transporter ATP-binding protein